ncbi:hypothetical protein AYO41_01755 [Verrucomicrobia bacterium SCGC AG-212-E04]|nr:hypothetical protein AYO41_01755 [Verrucomicrobia bacterium SCGC AG-212-E04]
MSHASSGKMTPLFPAGMIIDHTARDADQMTEFAAFWHIDQVQLQPGSYHGSILAFHTSNVQLAITYRSRSTRVRGQVPDGAVAFGLPLAFQPATYFRARRLARSEIAMARAGDEFIFQTTGAVRDVCLAISASLIERYAKSKWGEPLDARCRDGRLELFGATTATVAKRLAEIVRTTVAQRDQLASVTFCSRLDRVILEVLLDHVHAPDGSSTHGERREYAIKTKDYLHAHADRPLCMDELCGEFGRSSRILEIGFQEAFGMSLKARLQAIRFNGAHRDLRAAKGGELLVKEIAMRWGFMHLGRFSVTYRKWFGESPRATIGR